MLCLITLPSFSTLLAVTKPFGMALLRKLLSTGAQCMDTGTFLWVDIFYSLFSRQIRVSSEGESKEVWCF